MPDRDEDIRANKGIVLSLRRRGLGRSKITFDDVIGGSSSWTIEGVFTEMEYDDRILDSMRLSDAEYQAIGENVVARLLALNGRLK